LSSGICPFDLPQRLGKRPRRNVKAAISLPFEAAGVLVINPWVAG
jgi:hypothetical protein